MGPKECLKWRLSSNKAFDKAAAEEQQLSCENLQLATVDRRLGRLLQLFLPPHEGCLGLLKCERWPGRAANYAGHTCNCLNPTDPSLVVASKWKRRPRFPRSDLASCRDLSYGHYGTCKQISWIRSNCKDSSNYETRTFQFKTTDVSWLAKV